LIQHSKWKEADDASLQQYTQEWKRLWTEYLANASAYQPTHDSSPPVPPAKPKFQSAPEPPNPTPLSQLDLDQLQIYEAAKTKIEAQIVSLSLLLVRSFLVTDTSRLFYWNKQSRGPVLQTPVAKVHSRGDSDWRISAAMDCGAVFIHTSRNDAQVRFFCLSLFFRGCYI
jgi:hypothetical protein